MISLFSKHSAAAIAPTARRAKRAFTLIELLLVIAIVSLLVSLLLPGLSQVRDAARSIVCSNNLRQIAQSQLSYGNEYRELFAGCPASSGFDLLQLNTVRAGSAGDPRNAPGYIQSSGMASQFNGLAVQLWDFYGPLASFSGYVGPGEGATGAGLNGSNRFKRYDWYRSTLKPFQCPSNNVVSQAYDNTGDVPKAEAVEGTMLPYVMSTQFTSTENPNPFGTRSRVREGIDRNNYFPRTSKIGNMSKKVMVYEGHRYADQDTKPDFDITLLASYGGSFGDTGPWYFEDLSNLNSKSLNRACAPGEPARAAYVASRGVLFDARPWALRHGSKRPQETGGEQQYRGNFAFWDGHVEVLDDRQALDPDMWFPSGTKFTSPLRTWATAKLLFPAKTLGMTATRPYVVP